VERRRRSVRKLIACGVALVAALALLVPGAFGGEAQAPGVTARSITVGGTFPLTGPAAAYARIPLGMRAYFAYVNATRTGPDKKRGVYGRQIVWKFYDDNFNLTGATERLTRRLVEEDKVFATVGQLGTEAVRAAQGYLNDRKVPQLLVSTGASYWGTEAKKYPWTIGWQPDYIAEGRLYGLHIKRNHPGKKIAILYQQDDYGKDYLYGVRYALGPTYVRNNVVATEDYATGATSLTSQMVRIRQSGAQILVLLSLTTPSIVAMRTANAIGYKPEQIYMNSVSAIRPVITAMQANPGNNYINGTLSVGYFKDPQHPRWANDAAMKLYRQIIEKYGGGGDFVEDPQVMYGVAKAESFVQGLYRAGRNLTRQKIMNAFTNYNTTNRFLLPGIREKTGRKDRFIISQMQLQRLQNGLFQPVGGLTEGRPSRGK
jgi:branched-chain amino acid transport system substrate-binding protein